MTISEIFQTWLDTPNSSGLADDLRCVAMEVQDDYPEITRADYVAEATRRGFNPKTAARCWSYVKAQG